MTDIRGIKIPILPLQLLVYTPKGNIAVVGNYLKSSGLILNNPASPYDMPRLTNYHYFNPHHDIVSSQPLMASNPLNLVPRDHSRWATPTSISKTVDVQRNQVDELFKNLKDGDDLIETEPCKYRYYTMSLS